jgi:hypothetical protein
VARKLTGNTKRARKKASRLRSRISEDVIETGEE